VEVKMASFNLQIEQGDSGRWYVTSPELRGLLVCGDTIDEALGAVRPAGRGMLAVMRENGADHDNTQYSAYATVFG
jgi:predicted RNase H-like HicB family nuclease